MNCPHCNHSSSRVLESRATESGDAMRRRRECLDCETRYTTYERTEMPALWVTKHTGDAEQFDRDKLLRGLVRACNKRDVPGERLEALVIDIETHLRSSGARSVTSTEIGERAVAGLRSIDDVAYVRFASVYRAFETAGEFLEELEQMQSQRHGETNSIHYFTTHDHADVAATHDGHTIR